MFRIRRIHDDLTPANREALSQVRTILLEQLPGLDPAEADKIPRLLRLPQQQGFRSVLYVAERERGHILGFALLSHDPRLGFCWLDYLSTARLRTSGGVGGALYQAVREEAIYLDAIGLFFECLPDDPRLCSNAEHCRQNRARLRFYESYRARPITGTAYETPLREGGLDTPHLVFDGLDRDDRPLRRDHARAIVRAILQNRYGHLCSPEYTELVVSSFTDDPVQLREFRYHAQQAAPAVPPGDHRKITLVINDRHEIHHVKERGYVESPVRIKAILEGLDGTALFEKLPPREHPEKYIRAVHDSSYVDYFKTLCRSLEPGRSVYPYVFPLRNFARPPKDLAVRAGYFCIDTFTPLTANAWLAAKRAVDCALTAAERVLAGHPLAYALVRPPGHHAERRCFGGFCYFNNAAIAAHFLAEFGKVAILDVDYHHGNGQQAIFYDSDQVLTLSIHGHPRFAYPYFSGFEEEQGEGPGRGFNMNLPLPEHLPEGLYFRTLERALARIRRFDPAYLIVCLGLDTARRDPTGTWDLSARDFERMGLHVGRQGYPTLVVQEGGYNTRSIGHNARSFFQGLWRGAFARPALPARVGA